MKIYTKTGDNKTTSAGDHREFKDNDLFFAMGSLDEASACMSISLKMIEDQKNKMIIKRIIGEISILCGELVYPNDNFDYEPKLKQMENEIDELEKNLPPFTHFILYWENDAANHLNLARTIVRKSERYLVKFARITEVKPVILQYVNRLSDLLFVLCRKLENK